MVTRTRSIVFAAGLAWSATACSLVLGIEEAHEDPTLSAENRPDAGAGGSTATGSTAVTSTAAAGSMSNDAGTSGGGSSGNAGSTSGPDGAVAASDAADEGGSAVCRQYCDDVMSFCTGNVKQYLDIPQCLKVCALLPEGVVGNQETNTAACRMKYAANARYAAGSERDAYCRKAGPGSDGTCGTICEGFCSMMMPTCTRARTAPYFFTTIDSCLSTCRALPDDPPYSVSDGTLPDTNDSQCRLFHAASAVMDPDEHCEHAMGVTMCAPKVDGGADH